MVVAEAAGVDVVEVVDGAAAVEVVAVDEAAAADDGVGLKMRPGPDCGMPIVLQVIHNCYGRVPYGTCIFASIDVANL